MKKQLTVELAKLRMADLCARSEQCSFDITKKLKAKGLVYSDIMEVITFLTERDFINHKRYARSFARDKVRFSAWGRRKINVALRAKKIEEEFIYNALREIEEDDYKEALLRAASSKARQLDLSEYDGRLKLYRHLLSRGFESELSSAMVKKLSQK